MEVNERRLHSSPREQVERGKGGEREEVGEDGVMERLGRKLYSSSNTLKTFDNHHVVDFSSGEILNKHSAAQSLSLHQLGIYVATPRRRQSVCAETGLDHHIQNTGGVSICPDCTIGLWDRGVDAHGRESRLSSLSNSNLMLVDTDHDGKVERDGEFLPSKQAPPPPAPHQHKQHLSINSVPANQKAEFQSASKHFLLKTGAGSAALFATPTPGFTMATGAIYCPPARPFLQNKLSRGAFQFNKSPKHCSWKCTALIAVGVAMLLSIILCYCIVIHVFGLNWNLKDIHTHTFENGVVSSSTTKNIFNTHGRTDSGQDSGQVHVGQKKNALIGVYGRKGLPPSHTQYDFVELLDGSRLISRDGEVKDGMESPVSVHCAGFIQYVHAGVWHLAFYNDGPNMEDVLYNTTILESLTACPHNCYGNGDCVSGSCRCFPGFIGLHCSQAACPILCSGNGDYRRGRCHCYSGWKGTECDVPIAQCVDAQCSGHGVCVSGTCVCNRGYKGDNCDEEDHDTRFKTGSDRVSKCLSDRQSSQ